MMTHSGSCQCGAVAFEVEADIEEAMQCNCSICRRKGYLLNFVPAQALTLKTDEAALETYKFNKGMIAHQFCKTCGCAPFGQGEMPDGKKMAAINVRCLPEVDLDALAIKQVDGASF